MSAPLRVLMVAPQFRPLIGGYERAAERLSIGLVARGHAVDVVTDGRDAGWPAEESIEGVRVIRLRSVPRPGLHQASAVAALLRFLLRSGGRYDLLHAHQYGGFAGAAIGWALARRRPCVLKLTNTEHDGIEACLRREHLGVVLRPLHRHVTACVATSARAAAEAVAFGIPAGRVHRIPNPLDTARFAPATESDRAAARAALGLGSGFLAISVGRISPEKDHAMLVDAWSRVAPRHPGAVLAVLGSGPLESALRDRVERSPARDAIRLVGAVDDPGPWYAAADAFVLSSRHEGLSNSLMEAMACALPCVCTRVSGAEDVFESTRPGCIVDVGDAGALAAALEATITQPARREAWGRAARAYAEHHYALDRVLDATEALYAHITHTSRTDGPR